MPHTDGGVTSRRTPLNIRPWSSNPVNKIIHNTGHESLNQFIKDETDEKSNFTSINRYIYLDIVLCFWGALPFWYPCFICFDLWHPNTIITIELVDAWFFLRRIFSLKSAIIKCWAITLYGATRVILNCTELCCPGLIAMVYGWILFCSTFGLLVKVYSYGWILFCSMFCCHLCVASSGVVSVALKWTICLKQPHTI